MEQRKLDSFEKHWITSAATSIRALMIGCGCAYRWDEQFADLLAVADNGTTDGKPWIEPQPEIGDGYRPATAEDRMRSDRSQWSAACRTWVAACIGSYATTSIYRVPVEPQPEIGDGYRLATLSDAHRLDRQVWCDGFWLNAQIGHTETNRVYSVAKDRIPTDEDAVGRPTVMVRHSGVDQWESRSLVAVVKCDMPFITLTDTVILRFRYARFPYPGELD